MSDLVQVEIIDRIQVITINRPEARNAINVEVARGLAAALDQLDGDDDVFLGILTGAGNTFCSGMDLKAFARTGERPYVGARGFAGICERSEEHTSELQSLMRNTYAVFCLKKKKTN